MRIRLWILTATVIPALAFSEPASAGEDYRCTIERLEISFSSNKSAVEGMRAAYVGKQFTVERRTGLMAGALKNSFVTSPQVIDPGSRDNSFKAVTTSRLDQGAGGGSAIYVLIIGEFLKTRKKPFMFTENDTLYFGTCEHF